MMIHFFSIVAGVALYVFMMRRSFLSDQFGVGYSPVLILRQYLLSDVEYRFINNIS